MNITHDLWQFFVERLIFFLKAVKYSVILALILGPILALTFFYWHYSLAFGVGIASALYILKHDFYLKDIIAKLKFIKHDLFPEGLMN